jgi:hypothetical protein
MLKKIEDHATLVRALMYEASVNTSLSIGIFEANGLIDNHTKEVSKEKVLAILRKGGALALRNMPGMGHGSFALLIKLCLEQ